MILFTGKVNYLKLFTSYVKKNYLYSKMRLLELAVCVLLETIIYIMLSNKMVPQNTKGIIGEVQAFVSIYFVFRFSYLGMSVSIIFVFENTIGVLSLFFKSRDYNLLVGIIVNIVTIACIMIIGLLSGRQEKQKRRLHQLAITDELTDVYNQRNFHFIIEQEMNKAIKDKTSVGLILIDIDNFKQYNDIYGRDYGDKILKETARLLKAMSDENNIVFRYEGDEFAVILLYKDIETVKERAQFFKDEFERLKKKSNDFLYHKVTISIGLSEYPNMSNDKEELVSQADMALYQAKNSGKDKINFYQDIILQIRKNVKSDHQQLIGIFKGLLSVISAKDKYTLGHCERVGSYASKIGEAMNLGFKEISILQYAGLLHDIGKVELPKSVLNKRGCLTAEEINLIRMHPIYSVNILEPLEGMDQLIDYVRHHHEMYDGKGYPDAISGKNISLGSRILCVADSFDAMISERPYRKAMSIDEALNELEKCSGKQFDPNIVNIFKSIMSQEKVFKELA